MRKPYEVHIVKHVNYAGFVMAESQEEAEQIAAENTSEFNWVKMDGPQPTEICHQSGDYTEGESLE